MKLGAMIYSFSPAIRSGDMTQRQAIELCGELGLASVDTMDRLGKDPWPDVRTMVEDAGMAVASHITSADLATMSAAERRANMDAVRASVDDTLALGSDKLMVVTGNMPEDADRPTVERNVGEALAVLAEEAVSAGVRICIEDFPGERSPHRTSGELLKVCALAGPDLGICFDTGNFYSGGEEPGQAWPRLASRAIHCHAKDWRWDAEGRHSTPDGRRFSPELVGRGILDYPSLLKQMAASGYEAAVSFEYEGPMDRADAAREGIAYLRSLLE